MKLIDETANYLGMGIVSLAHVIDPDVVLLGGAMTFGGNQTVIGKKFLTDIREVVKNCSLPAVAENLKIDYASLGGDAGFVGAAYLARRDYQTSQNASLSPQLN